MRPETAQWVANFIGRLPPEHRQTAMQMVEVIKDASKNTGARPDIPNREERDQFVLDRARKEFELTGQLHRQLIMRTRKPNQRLVRVVQDIPYELAHLGGRFTTGACMAFNAQQLYLVSEVWFAQVTKEEGDARLRGDADRCEVRHMPNRKEGLLVISEDPWRQPPILSWFALITRDDEGNGTAGEWDPDKYGQMQGRLIHVLPPEAYLYAGKSMPQA